MAASVGHTTNAVCRETAGEGQARCQRGPTPVASIGGPRGRRGQATTVSGRERRHDNTLGHDAKFYVIKRSTAVPSRRRGAARERGADPRCLARVRRSREAAASRAYVGRASAGQGTRRGAGPVSCSPRTHHNLMPHCGGRMFRTTIGTGRRQGETPDERSASLAAAACAPRSAWQRRHFHGHRRRRQRSGDHRRA